MKKSMNRRDFLEKAAAVALRLWGTLLAGCGLDPTYTQGSGATDAFLTPSPIPSPTPSVSPQPTISPEPPAPSPPVSPPPPPPNNQVTLYDTYARVNLAGALPNSIVISAEQVKKGMPWEIEFDFGHPGAKHKATIGSAEISKFKKMEKVQITSSSALFHNHTVTIDFSDTGQRVPGSQPVAMTK